MSCLVRAFLPFTVALVLLTPAKAQHRVAPRASPQVQTVAATPARTPSAVPIAPTAVQNSHLISTVTLADIGLVTGFRFANLGGRRELFVPMPQDDDITAAELILVFDDVSAHDAKRNLEVLINDRTVSTIALDGHSSNRVIRVPLAGTKARDGFIKMTFIYSGAATPDRCIDVRYVGDSLTIRPDTAIAIDVGVTRVPDVVTTFALMPRDVAIVLPARTLNTIDIASALTVARTLMASGRKTTFYQDFKSLPEISRRTDPTRWTRGVVVIGTLDEAAPYLDAPLASVAGQTPTFGTLGAVRIGGAPALLVSDIVSVSAAKLLASPDVGATRGVSAASVGDNETDPARADRMNFDQLGIAPMQADVFGRADLTTAVDMRRLPAGTRARRFELELLVAPDGAGEKAVVSGYVNDRLLGSTVAAIDEPTRLELPLPDGIIGTVANLRVVVQRRSAQGDCRFEPQGYPTQILGSSSVALGVAGSVRKFSDFTAAWGDGLTVWLPAAAAEHPLSYLNLIAEVVSDLTGGTVPIAVNFATNDALTAFNGPFLSADDKPPAGVTLRVRFDQGRVSVTDRANRTLLDLGGFSSGAVAQIVTANNQPGIWIRSLGADRALPSPAELKLEHGDVAFIDGKGVALAMATDRDTMLRITYPEHTSWFAVIDQFRPWIIAALWLAATLGFLYLLQRVFRRRPREAGEQ